MVCFYMLKKVAQHQHHEKIYEALKQFNAAFLNEHNILFGGGTRIALELNEYRESVDIDFICPNKDSYKAVRNEVSNISLGNIVTKDFDYIRDIRSDRDAVRTAIKIDNTPIKLEFVSFADYELTKATENKFIVPYLDIKSCYVNKLLANADRYKEYKDIFDLMAMFHYWGPIPDDSWDIASEHYTYKTLFYGLEQAFLNKDNYLEKAKEYSVNEEVSSILMTDIFPKFEEYIAFEKSRRM
jgi:hypothetical protein